MMKIGVVGKGTVGIIAVLQIVSFLKTHNLLKQVNITIMYDPSTPVIGVGEATTWVLEDALYNVLGAEATKEVLEGCNFTYREGVKFLWKDLPRRDFNINYNSRGVHFDSGALGDLTLPLLQEKYGIDIIETSLSRSVDGTIKDSTDFDLLLDCGGSPTPMEVKYSGNYIVPEFKSVNSVLLMQVPSKGDGPAEDLGYSHSVVHDNGWMFMIPLQHRKAYGYLYNSNITHKDEAVEDFISIQPEVTKEGIKHLSWDFYYRKDLMKDNVIYLGNRLFFFEPAQAIPIHFYFTLLESVLGILSTTLIEGSKPKALEEFYVNKEYSNKIQEALTVLGFNYTGDMGIHTEFWDSTTTKAREFVSNSPYYLSQYQKYLKGETEAMELWTHESSLMEQYIKGFDIPQPNSDGRYE